MSKNEMTKQCKHCMTEIPKKAKVCPNCKRKQGGKGKVVLIVLVVLFIIGIFGSDAEENNSNSSSSSQIVKEKNTTLEKEEITPDVSEPEVKKTYNVGDIYEDKYIRIKYTNAYEFTDFNDFNRPSEGNIVICAEFEVENIGDTDHVVMYTDFDGYADGYEVQQSYSPEKTGMDFSLDLSPGRKGVGVVAFEVPEDSSSIEIEYSPNVFTSERVTFIYK